MMQLGLEPALLINPVDNLAIRSVATDRVAQQLPDSRVIILVDRQQQLAQPGLQYIPRQIVFIGAHDHWMLRRYDVIADQQFFIELFAWPQSRELDGYVAMGVLFGAQA